MTEQQQSGADIFVAFLQQHLQDTTAHTARRILAAIQQNDADVVETELVELITAVWQVALGEVADHAKDVLDYEVRDGWDGETVEVLVVNIIEGARQPAD